MRRSSRIVCLSAMLLLLGAADARAFRPFDGTDAAVADTGQLEIELGPLQYLREGSARSLIAPAMVVNYGFASGWEGVVQGNIAHGLSGGVPGSSLSGAGVSLKGILREGSLQDKEGPSVATEFGVLLPGIRDDHGTGASVAGIVSQRWEWGTAHLNVAASLTRQQHADLFLAAILEAPHDWPVRPVAEVFYDRDFAAAATRSALIGAIWQAGEELAFDIGLRGARVGDHTTGEIRLGATFAFALAR
jgi:hypothetical protein